MNNKSHLIGTALRQLQRGWALTCATVASTPRLTSAVLQQAQANFETRQQLDVWSQQPSRDIHDRLAAYQTLPGAPQQTPAIPSSHSLGSSMARTQLHQPSNASGYAPSLLFSEATPTESSVSTGLASRLSGFQLLEEVDGVLELRPNLRSPVYECAFWFLSCSYISQDKEEWRTHCASHFRGEEPPKSVQCPLCEEFRGTYEDGRDAWNARMEHVAWHHGLGQTLRTSRPDFHLFQHLWQKRLIDDADLKELKGGNHNLTRAPQPFLMTNGRGRPGRRESHTQRLGQPRRR